MKKGQGVNQFCKGNTKCRNTLFTTIAKCPCLIIYTQPIAKHGGGSIMLRDFSAFDTRGTENINRIIKLKCYLGMWEQSILLT